MDNKCRHCESRKVSYVIRFHNSEFGFCEQCFNSLPQDQNAMQEFLMKSLNNRQRKNIQNEAQAPKDDDQRFLIDLTEEMKNHNEPILFRDKELERTIQILSRKTKNNPVLIGEPGVGKTAVAELLAKKIANNEIPRFTGHKVYSFNFSSFMSGTKFRGEFEANFEKLMESLDDKSILFIDEFHLVMGAGASNSSDIDLSNLLKPYLSRGKLKLIGATTLDEFRKIEKDEAFNRRMQPVDVKAFSKDETLELMQQLKKPYESFHKVSISEVEIKQIVDLADEFLKNRNFPDKAIDLLDEVSSRVSIKRGKHISKEEQAKIDEMKTQTINFFSQYGENISSKLNQIIDDIEMSEEHPVVEESDILQVVEDMSGIPVSVLKSGNKDRIRNLEKELKEKVIGQDEAIALISKSAKRSLVRLKKRKKPTVLFFAGPTGVGKTESAKALANSMFGSEESLIRFDMSEYMEEHTVSKLIGSPPGYVGHEDEGQLSEKVRRNPYSIILLDEFEKAHPKISRLFLQVFDDGRLTDSKGRVIDFSNTIIIMTSNIGTSTTKSLGFGVDPKKENQVKTNEALKKEYPPEFLNRIDEVIIFNALTKENLLGIADLIIADYKKEIFNLGVELNIDEKAKEFLVDKGYNAALGARPLARTITREVEDLVVEHLLEVEDETVIQIELADDSLTIKK